MELTSMLDEYRQLLQWLWLQDPALERRFQQVLVQESFGRSWTGARKGCKKSQLYKCLPCISWHFYVHQFLLNICVSIYKIFTNIYKFPIIYVSFVTVCDNALCFQQSHTVHEAPRPKVPDAISILRGRTQHCLIAVLISLECFMITTWLLPVSWLYLDCFRTLDCIIDGFILYYDYDGS